MQSGAHAMEQIPLVETQNLGIIPASILECWQFGTEQHVSLFGLLIGNTLENR